MYRSRLSLIVAIAVPLGLAACATKPDNINNVCAVFEQKDGFVNNWHRDAKRAESRYGVPVPVLMATVRKESGFDGRARPARKKLLGFIPWKRASSAYGYSQALDGTWLQYQRETGNYTARRADFGDAIDFVGWYHSTTARKFGVATNDMFNLYLAYYHGWGGYARGDWRHDASILNYAQETADMAQRYAAQMQRCGYY